MRALSLLTLAVVASCSESSERRPADTDPPKTCDEPTGAFAPLSTRCGQFVDADGRVVVLRGINARVRGVFDADLGPGKVPLMNPIPELTDDDLKQMRRIGFDLLRLPINWSAIEPEEGKYDDAYLTRIAEVVGRAKSAGVLVLVDVHQDAYSKWIGQDGAPLWAIVPPPDTILEGPLDDLGDRRISQQVLKAFATFFSRTSPDGQRLRARFAAMTAKVAEKLVGNDNVLAIELFNEPQATDDELRGFHEEIGAAVRKVDAKRLIAFEPTALRNFLDRATIPSKPLALDGTIYAPHVYTGVFSQGCDDACRNNFDLDKIAASNDSARAEADGWKAPLLIGEIGFDPRLRFADWVALQLDHQDRLMASSAWWVWKENSEGSWGFYDWNATSDTWTERVHVRKAFARVQPRLIAGWPQHWKWDASAKRFELVVLGDTKISAPHVLHVPFEGDGPMTWKITCDGKSVSASPDARGDLSVQCHGEGVHTVVVEGS
jgi:endoglycosylceramidase